MMATGANELEADANSLTCKQSGLSFNDRLGNDNSKSGFKRPRAGMAESFSEIGTATSASPQDTYNSDFSSIVAPSIGEPLSPSPSCSAGSTYIKVSNSMETSQRRSNQDNCTSESGLRTCSRLRPTLFVIPFPALLVGLLILLYVQTLIPLHLLLLIFSN